MKTTVLAFVLACAVAVSAQDATQQPSQPPAGGAGAQQPAGQPSSATPEIKGPAEYNAYVGAIQQQDAPKKISALEAFHAADEERLDAMITPFQERMQQMNVMLNLISEQQLISDRTKAVAYRALGP